VFYLNTLFFIEILVIGDRIKIEKQNIIHRKFNKSSKQNFNVIPA